MCDLRPPPYKVFNKQTKEWKDLPFIGHFSVENSRNELPKEFGIYHRVGSGCGYEFYDGDKWWSINSAMKLKVWGEERWVYFDDENEKYKFARPIQDISWPLNFK